MMLRTPYGPAAYTLDDHGALVSFTIGVSFAFRADAAQDGAADTGESEVARQVAEYFAGLRQEFDLPLAPKGSAFQKRVWAELVKIPFGETVSYTELARRIGMPGAARAVGRANATNPIWLIVPCHRVIGAGGRLTGYAGGIDLKEKLLNWERKVSETRMISPPGGWLFADADTRRKPRLV